MITFELQNLHSIDVQHGLPENEWRKYEDRISDYLKKIHARDQGFYRVIDDDALTKSILEFAADVKGRFRDIVVLGVGGSSLGTICLQQSLNHLFENERENRKVPRLHVIDNIDPILLREFEELIDLKKTLFLVITKSGGTPETLSQYFYFQNRVKETGLKTEDHFVFVTDPSKGLLRKIAEENPNIKTFEVPPNVGGRFSVLTAVGLVPAALIGIDIENLLRGARSMREAFLSEDFNQNLPFQFAAVQYALAEKGKTMAVMMPYSQKLIRFADWYRQLLAESIGKAQNEKGETVNVGITPVNALGVTDQHSQSQLYNEGPNDKLLIFLEVEDHGDALPIPNPYPGEQAVNFLEGVTFNQLLQTEMRGTIQSLTENSRPNVTIRIPCIDAKNLGALFLLFEGSIAFLGEFYGINAFDQPGVERSKILTKELLKS